MRNVLSLWSLMVDNSIAVKKDGLHGTGFLDNLGSDQLSATNFLHSVNTWRTVLLLRMWLGIGL
jgi:hypothetical protein